MPRKYKRKTDRGAPTDVLERAKEQVLNAGSSIRAAAKDFNIARMTLKRYIDKDGREDETFGFKNCQLKNMIFSPEMETELASHIKRLAEQFHGLSRDKCRTLIFEYAVRNGIPVPESWRENEIAGRHFWISFKERNHLAIRTPEATSQARASAFNRYNVGRFFNNLAEVMDLHKFGCHEIFNVDETGCTTVQDPQNIVRQVGSITSAERGQLVTAVYGVSAAGTIVPPMLIFPRKNFRDHFIKSGPPGCIGGANPSGWINEDLFVEYLQHFIKHTRCSIEKKVLVILDNHETHISLAAVDLAKANGVILLTIPPHTSHKLQPLDRTCFKPFKAAYGRAIENWMRSNAGKTATIYEIPEFTLHAQLCGLTAANIMSGFRSTGIYPYNRDMFGDADFVAAAVTDRDIPATADPQPGPGATPTADPQPGRGATPTDPQPGPSATPIANLQPGPGATPTDPQPGPSATPIADLQPGLGATPTADPQPGLGATPIANLKSALGATPTDLQPGLGATPSDPQPGLGATPSDPQPGLGATPSDLQPGLGATPTADLQPGLGATPTADLQPGLGRLGATPMADPQPRPNDTPTAIPQPGPSDTSTADPQPGPHDRATKCPGHISPADILPLPRAGPRKSSYMGRRKGDTKILTNTPVRNSIAETLLKRNKQKEVKSKRPAQRSLFGKSAKKRRSPSPSSSSESGMSNFDSEDSDTDNDFNDEIIEGDFVVVKFQSVKSRFVHYIARIDVIDGDECEGVFLQREFSRVQTKPTFIINESDVSSFPKNDIIKKLPVPQLLGGTARRASKLTFPCNFMRWDFHSSLY